jgi:hypothetical protein
MAGDEPEMADRPEGGRGASVSGRALAAVLVVGVLAVAVAGWLGLDMAAHRDLPGTPLAIQTDPPLASGVACGSQVIPPARLLVVRDALTLVASNGGADIAVVWPSGYAARDDQGRGGLYDPSGYLVAQEGENLQERFFGAADAHGTFHVCRIARD